MKTVEAALIERIVGEYLDGVERRVTADLSDQAVVSSHFCHVRRVSFAPGEAANEPYFDHRKRSVTDRLRELAIFFETWVKNCAKSARTRLENINFAPVDKRQRATLAACFFAFFSLFPSNTHSANLSTTP